MTAEAIQPLLDDATADVSALSAVHVFDSLPSTNTWLKERAPLAVGQSEAVLALHQTAGRGRLGKVWQAPAKSGLCLSVSHQYETMPADVGAISLALGVTVGRVLESLGSGEIMLKWPNDIVWQDQKLGGILAESTAGADGFRVIAGIGINLDLPDGFDPTSANAWSDGAADLISTGLQISLVDLAKAMIPEVVETLASFSAATLAETVEAFNRRHWLRDRAAELEGRMLRCDDVDEKGRLRVVDMQDGQIREIDSGEVTPLAWSGAS
ncbi:MAG: biotin--[acetyl-CoA-carboxylase] ligase [Woeseiaceae bacterium]